MVLSEIVFLTALFQNYETGFIILKHPVFQTWSAAGDVIGKMPGNVDVKVSFVPRVHSEEHPFDDLDDTLRQAFWSNLGGDLHIDEDEHREMP